MARTVLNNRRVLNSGSKPHRTKSFDRRYFYPKTMFLPVKDASNVGNPHVGKSIRPPTLWRHLWLEWPDVNRQSTNQPKDILRGYSIIRNTRTDNLEKAKRRMWVSKVSRRRQFVFFFSVPVLPPSCVLREFRCIGSVGLPGIDLKVTRMCGTAQLTRKTREGGRGGGALCFVSAHFLLYFEI